MLNSRGFGAVLAAVAISIGGGCVAEVDDVGTAAEASRSRHGRRATLRNAHDPVLWSSRIEPGDSVSGGPAICASVACERFDVNVSLPRGVWSRPRAGSLQIQLRWFGFGDNVFLYVYRDGVEVGRQEGIISTSYSLHLPNAPNGNYSIYVAWDDTSINDTIAYEGNVEVEYAPRAHPRRELLPDLAARPQRNVTFDTPLPIFFEQEPIPGESCNPSEMDEDGARTCLRFDQVLANIGEGALDMLFVIPHDDSSDIRHVFQNVFWSDGSMDTRIVDEWEFHGTHGHYHYNGFAVSRLWASDGAGNRVGTAPLRSGRKVSFCVADIEVDEIGVKGDGPRVYNAPDCLFPANSDSMADYLVQGLTSGWADVYDWFLPGQYVEVSGVPDGVYVLETVADPDDTILEADETNNCGSVLIRLSDMHTSAPRAELLGPGPSC